jgi:hypothetical protein
MDVITEQSRQDFVEREKGILGGEVKRTTTKSRL